MQSTLRGATEKDALYLSSRLRPEDVKELRASSGLPPLDALIQGMELSAPHAYVLCDPVTGEPYLMGGVRPVDTFGIVWLLATPDVSRHALTVQREAKQMLRRIFTTGAYQALCNVVSADNHTAIAWLYRLGFIFVHINQPIGRCGELFHSFAIGRPDNV